MPKKPKKTKKSTVGKKPAKNTKRKRKKTFWKKILAFMPKIPMTDIRIFFARLFGLALIWLGILGFLYICFCAIGLPDVRKIKEAPIRPFSIIEASDGSILARYGDLVGKTVNAQELPKHVSQAILAIEDRRFYSHFGIDILGIIRAGIINAAHGKKVQGGSTLSQQLAKNLFLSSDKTIHRKVQEVLLAIWLEHKYSKEEILSSYLNRVYLGSGAYGIDAAAQTYFNKNAAQLNIMESAIIAGLLKAPSRFSPINNKELSLERAGVVLNAMEDAGYLTKAQVADILKTPVQISVKLTSGSQGRYFADFVYSQIAPMLDDIKEDVFVRTTYDTKLDAFAYNAVKENLDKHSSDKNVSEAALLSLAPDGAILAMIGGRDYKTSQFNRAVQAIRQPGSTFKPIVYLAALERGLIHPDDIIEDEPIAVGKYAPSNFDHKFRGPISVSDALAHSINTVAVRLLTQTGVSPVIQLANNLGISSKIERDYSIALGSSSLSVLELAQAYAGIASGGKAVTPYAVKEVRTRSGKIIFNHEIDIPAQVAETRSADKLISMMEKVISNGTGKGAQIQGRQAAGKTGTASDYRDAWFAGFTGNYITVVWVGNDDNSPMKGVSGAGLPAVIWRDYMTNAESLVPPKSLANKTFIDSISDTVIKTGNFFEGLFNIIFE
ncbi:MAG: PBP1A family penicillin-binding protein [Alphaproteobacteria bacterium]|nr:PBP1A family penicillin-binding protein [Alphaproteobacteria bacterium]MCL2505922.1 PBP1A family penicillin-binding protein [Alphaproteobacteria bacterium]